MQETDSEAEDNDDNGTIVIDEDDANEMEEVTEVHEQGKPSSLPGLLYCQGNCIVTGVRVVQ